MDTVDSGGRRSDIDRRQFSYLIHIPERRSGKDRRSGFDRRSLRGSKLENSEERRMIFL